MIARLLSNRVRRFYLGGSRIDAFTRQPSATAKSARRGISPDADGVPRPEDWLASTTQAFNGVHEIDGEGLGRLEDGRLVRDVVGDLPILVKLLDSDERLVIQAHPTVPCAKRLFNSGVGKTECWYFLPGTAEGACVYLGFKPGITRHMWREAFDAQKGLIDMLHRIPVGAGDFVFVDGGIPHAIGGGCFMVELQEPSDLMVVAERVTPSGRRIPDDKMHCGVGWERMFDVYEYEGLTFEETCARYVRRSPGETCVCSPEIICGPEFTDKFTMWRMGGDSHLELSRSACAVVVNGSGAVNDIAVKKGDRLVIVDEMRLDVQGDVMLVICS